MHFVIVKQSLVSANESHFSGGKHVVQQMASSLAAQGRNRVSLVSVSTRGEVMVAAVHQGFLSRLCTTQQGVIEWESDGVSNYVICEQLRDQPQQTPSQAAPPTSSPSDIALQELVLKLMNSSQPAKASLQQAIAVSETCTDHSAGSVTNNAWLILDADDLQKTQQQQRQQQHTQTLPLPDQGLQASPSFPPCHLSSAPSPSLFESLALSLPGQVIALVQNIYFLPFGPSGTTPSSPGLIQAWASLAGVMAVSEFVAGYLQRWGNCTWQAPVPDLSCLPGSAPSPASRSGNHTSRAVSIHQTPHSAPSALGLTQNSSGISKPAVMVIHLCAWGVFGGPTFPDFGARVTGKISQVAGSQASSLSTQGISTGMHTTSQQKYSVNKGSVSNTGGSSVSDNRMPSLQSLSGCEVYSRSEVGRGTSGGESACPRPVIGMMKMMPEKGSSIVLELARRLPEYDFLAVTGDPNTVATVAAAALPNLTLSSPQPRVDFLLQHMWLLLVPSLWEEAWGMVATEAMLRGIPVITSNLGGLPEAGLHVCSTVQARAMVIPLQATAADISDSACQMNNPGFQIKASITATTTANTAPNPAFSSAATVFNTIWSDRFYPDQDIDPWICEIKRLLGACGGGSPTSGCACQDSSSFGCPLSTVYETRSKACRAAALAFVGSKELELEKFQLWCKTLQPRH